MVVAEYYTEDIVRLTKLKKDQIIDGLTNLGAPSTESEDKRKVIVELTPNRVDLLHIAGVARALRAFEGEEKPRTYEPKRATADGYEVIVDKSVAKIRPYTACAVAKGLDFSGRNLEYLIQFQEKLHATLGRNVKKMGMGFYPLETLKFPIRYTTREPEEIIYQPLNYPKAAGAREILEKHPKGREYGWIIAPHERYPVFLDATGEVLCLIPICNSERFGKVTERTRDVFIEVTGNDLGTNLATLDILACAFIDAGATIHRVKMRYTDQTLHTPLLKTKKTKLDMGFVGRVLGSPVSATEAKRLLERMDMRVEITAGNGVVVVTPPYRVDIMHMVDVVEDIAIAHGYNNFKPTLPDFFSEGQQGGKRVKLDAALRGMGFQEMQSFVLTGAHRLKQYDQEQPVRILNPVSDEFGTLRPSLLPGLLETFNHNKVKGLPQQVYEVGSVQLITGQEKRVALGMMDRKVSFAHMRGILQTLAKEMGWQMELRPLLEHPWLEKRYGAEVWMDGSSRGVVGRVKTEFLARWRLDFEVYVVEIATELPETHH